MRGNFPVAVNLRCYSNSCKTDYVTNLTSLIYKGTGGKAGSLQSVSGIANTPKFQYYAKTLASEGLEAGFQIGEDTAYI